VEPFAQQRLELDQSFGLAKSLYFLV